MSNRPSKARQRAAEIISDYRDGVGAFAPRGSSTATTPSRGSTGGNSAEAARARMMQRMEWSPTKEKETYLQSISRRRWEGTNNPYGRILTDDD